MTYSRPKLPVWGRAGTEVRFPGCLLIALSTQNISSWHVQGMKDKGSDKQLGFKQPWKAPQSSLPQRHMLTESTEEAKEIRPLVITLFLMKPFGLLIGFAGLEMYSHGLFPSREEVWLGQAKDCQFMAWKHTAQELHTPCIPCPPPASTGHCRKKE